MGIQILFNEALENLKKENIDRNKIPFFGDTFFSFGFHIIMVPVT